MNQNLAKILILITSVCIGMIVCLFFQGYLGLDNCSASAMTGLMASFLPDRYNEIKANIYCASFVAMGSLVSSWLYVIPLSLITAVLILIIGRSFTGLGGKLGAMAFLSSIIFYSGTLI